MEDSLIASKEENAVVDEGVNEHLLEIQKLLLKPRNQRSSSVLNRIYKHLSGIPFFRSLDQGCRFKMSNCVNLMEVKSGQQIQKAAWNHILDSPRHRADSMARTRWAG